VFSCLILLYLFGLVYFVVGGVCYCGAVWCCLMGVLIFCEWCGVLGMIVYCLHFIYNLYCAAVLLIICWGLL